MLSPEEQVKAILKTFEDVKLPIRHPKNPSLKVVEVLPLFPDFEFIGNSYVQCSFDSNPAIEAVDPKELSKRELQKSQVDQAILKPIVNPTDREDNFLLFSIPNEESVLKRKRHQLEDKDESQKESQSQLENQKENKSQNENENENENEKENANAKENQKDNENQIEKEKEKENQKR